MLPVGGKTEQQLLDCIYLLTNDSPLITDKQLAAFAFTGDMINNTGLQVRKGNQAAR